jgi:hypothetical protein
MAKSAAGSTPAGAPPRTNRRGRRISYHLAAPVGGVNFQASNCTVLAPGTAAPGTAVQFTDKGAQKLTNMHLVLIFWGVEWAGSPLVTPVVNAVQNLLAGPYMTYLTQYGVRRANLWGTVFATGGDPPSPFSYANVGQFNISQLDADNLPEPDSDWPLVYGVIMPSNSTFQGDNRIEAVPLPPGTLSQVLGANSSIVWNDYDLFDVDNDPAHYFWVGNIGAAATQANVDAITEVLSHELLETCTDPNNGNGLVQIGAGSATSQIGDAPCNGWCDRVRGVLAQSYWVHNLGDPLNGQCVLPKFYSVRRSLAGRSIGGRLSTVQKPIPSLNQLVTSLFA